MKTTMTDAAIEEMENFSINLEQGRVAGRNEYMAAFEKIVAAGASAPGHDPRVKAFVEAAQLFADEIEVPETASDLFKFTLEEFLAALAAMEK